MKKLVVRKEYEGSEEVRVLCAELQGIIAGAYEEAVTITEAEKLAAKCLAAQCSIANELEVVDLEARMRKHGVKAVRAQAYMDEINKYEKKPSEGFLENAVELNASVQTEQRNFAEAETYKDWLTGYFGIFKDGHIYFRGIAKGKYE